MTSHYLTYPAPFPNLVSFYTQTLWHLLKMYASSLERRGKTARGESVLRHRPELQLSNKPAVGRAPQLSQGLFNWAEPLRVWSSPEAALAEGSRRRRSKAGLSPALQPRRGSSPLTPRGLGAAGHKPLSPGQPALLAERDSEVNGRAIILTSYFKNNPWKKVKYLVFKRKHCVKLLESKTTVTRLYSEQTLSGSLLPQHPPERL